MNVDSDRGLFGPVLRRLRREAGISQEELAERARLSVESISALERGRRRSPYRETIGLLSDALRLSDAQRRELESAAKRRPSIPSVSSRSASTVDGAERGDADATVARRFEETRHNLIRPLNTFHGRRNELGDLETLLVEHAQTSIVGPGGIGKTRIALELGWRVLSRFDDGVWFVDLAPLSDDAAVEQTLIATLGIPHTSAASEIAALVHHLERRKLLLILDNCEHVARQVAELTALLLAACPDLHILITSRESLRIDAERVYRIGPLEAPTAADAVSAARSLEFASVGLFVDRSKAANATFSYTDPVAAVIGQLCRRLDGIALAIELAASRTAAFSPQQILAQLDDHFGVLAGRSRTAPPRHRTMRETIRWSYDRLPETEQKLFRWVAVFVNGFTAASAQALTRTLPLHDLTQLDLIGSLVDRSLFVADVRGSHSRYRLLEPVRAFALEMLDEAGERDAVHQRYATWCQEFIDEAHSAWETMPSVAWSAFVEPEVDNLRAVLVWSLERRNAVAAGQRLAASGRRLWGRLFPSEGKRWVATARGSIDATTPREIVAALALAEAHIDISLEQYASALDAVRRYESLIDERTGEVALAEAHGFAGSALVKLGRTEEGEVLIKAALDVYRKHGAGHLTANGLNYLGIVHFAHGDLTTTRRLFREALQIFCRIGNDRGASSAAANLAETEFRAGDVGAAVDFCEQALATCGNGREARLHLTNLAAYLIVLGRFAEAREKARESIVTGGVGREDVDVAFALQHLAAIAALRPADTEFAAGDAMRAARLIGFIDARLAHFAVLREYTEQHEYDILIAALEAKFNPEHLRELRLDGGFWNEDTAVDEALLI